jgi:hypothetical protein
VGGSRLGSGPWATCPSAFGAPPPAPAARSLGGGGGGGRWECPDVGASLAERTAVTHYSA